MQIRFTFLNFIYIINIFSFSSYAQQVTYLPNSNQGQAQQQYYNPGNQNGGNGMPPQQFNQNNMTAPFPYQNGMIQTPQQQFQPANLQNNNNPNINNQNGQINNEMQPAPVFQQQYQYDPNQSNMQNNINNNNQTQQQFGQNNSNEQVDVTPDSLVIMPENSGIYYVAAPDVFPIDMIQNDMKDSNGNNTNENGFWLFISRMKDLNKQVIDQIQNRSNNDQTNNNQTNSNNNIVQPVISNVDNDMSNNQNNTGNSNNNYNNTSNNSNDQSNNDIETNNNNQSPIVNNQFENGQTANNSNTSNIEQSNNSSTDNNNKQFNNNQSQQNNNQQLPLQMDAKDVTMINNDSNNTTIVDNNTPIMLTPVSVNGNTVCAITRAKPSQKNDNLPTLSDSQQQTAQN